MTVTLNLIGTQDYNTQTNTIMIIKVFVYDKNIVWHNLVRSASNPSV